MEAISGARRTPLDVSDMQRMEFPLYVYKPRRGVKRGDESKETYKLPHRLIEKKRRDRINECIAQLKDLLPEHLKLTTLGHLEKAVVLELTLKHVKALSALLEQQQQKILALQKDLQIGDHDGGGLESGGEMFRSGFHLCAKEVLHYLARQDGGGDLSPSHVMSHIQKVATEVLQHESGPAPAEPAGRGPDRKPGGPPRATQGPAKNCVPVIQRTYAHGTSEQSGSDTDTDSGYGGEQDKRDARARLEGHAREAESNRAASERTASERAAHERAAHAAGDEPRVKRPRCDSSEDEMAAGRHAAGGGYMSFSPNQHPLCLPFYLTVPPSAAAAAAYLPMLEKCWYPGGMPVMYPGLSGAAPGLPPDTLPSSLVMSPRAGSPGAMDAPPLHKALKQVPPLNLETDD